MSEFLNNLGKIGMVLQAGGGSLAGRDGMAVVRDWEKQQQEEQKRKVVADILAGSGIGGPQRALLEQMPTADAIPTALQMMAQMEAQRQARAAAGAAEARRRQEEADRQAFLTEMMGGGSASRADSPYNTGTPGDFIVPNASLSLGQPAAAPRYMPAPPPTAPSAAPNAAPMMPLSFGESVNRQPPEQPFQIGPVAIRQAIMKYGAGHPIVKDLEALYKLSAPPDPGNDYERYVAREIARGVPENRIPDEFTYREMVAEATSGESAREMRIAELAKDLVEEGEDPAKADRIARGIVEGRLRADGGQVFDLGRGDIAGFTPVNPAEPSRDPGLYDRAPDATGVLSGAAALSTNTLGQLPGVGGIFQFPDQVQARQAYGTATNNLIRSLSINPRFPVAEMERIRGELGFTPSVWNSPASTQARMIELDRYLARRMEIEAEFANQPGNPIAERNAAVRAVRDMQAFREELGVPAQANQWPAVGTVEDGWEYVGGDPAQPESWRKAN